MNITVENFNEREKGIFEYLKRNGEPGKSTGFICLDELYTIKQSGVTDWTGFPASGKTYFVLELLITASEKYGQRHALYVPDIGNYNEVWSKLFQMVCGKNFSNKYGNQATETDILQQKDWINYHFIILTKKDIKKAISPVDVWEWVCDFKDEAGIIHNCLIDSWKNLSHDFGSKREDLYLDTTLSYRNELADAYKKHFHTIAHAAKTEMDVLNEHTDDTGKRKHKRRIPDANDIKGGGSWYANGKSIITIDYPNKKSNQLDIYVSKTKPEGVGSIGSLIGRIALDYSRSRYYELINGQKRFTFTTEEKLKENTNFETETIYAEPF